MKKYILIISELDYLTIKRVRELREMRGMSQRKLTELMGLSKSFVGKVEAFRDPDKYSIRHLYLIAKAFGLKSYKELLPKEINANDLIKIVYTKIPKVNKDGTVSESKTEDKVLEISPYFEKNEKNEPENEGENEISQ